MLKELESRLSAEGFEVHRIAASEAAPVDQLAVVLDADKQGRERSLWLTPLPGLEADLDEELSLLQFLAPLPFQAGAGSEAESAAALATQILQLNNALPLGGFGLRQPGGVILYRAVLLLGPDAAINGRVVGEAVTLIHFLLDQFSDAIEAAARG
jgi:hypothetical protein